MTHFIDVIFHLIGAFLRALASLFEAEPEPTAEAWAALGPQGSLYKPGELDISSSDRPAYRRSRSVLSPSEKVLYEAIRSATQGKYAVLMKVRMADFLFLANEPPDRKFHNNQILCKHVDFLLCEHATLRPLLVVELDDPTHKSSGFRVESDLFKTETLAATGIPLIRMQVQQHYNAQDLGAAIAMNIAKAS